MNIDDKFKLLKELESNVIGFRKVSSDEYKGRCPICGDSQKSLSTGHLYIKCNYDPNDPILYKCFLCNAGGIVNTYFLGKLGVELDDIPDLKNQLFNRITSIKKTNIDIITGEPVLDSIQVKYIEHRIGKGLNISDYNRFKIIWNMESIIPYITDARVKNTIPSNRDSISFLSDDKSILLTRFFETDSPTRWKKNTIFPSGNRSFYTIKSTIDLFTKDPMTVSIAEGVFDILSVYKNFGGDSNSIYVATLGSDYESGVNYTISNGFIGSNVILKVYIDSDIDEKILRYRLKKYKWLFGKIFVYKNISSEDFGVTIDKIKPIEYQL